MSKKGKFRKGKNKKFGLKLASGSEPVQEVTPAVPEEEPENTELPEEETPEVISPAETVNEERKEIPETEEP
ncbi:MAG: hypothetical protein K6A40_11755, partial [Solobacterium sp.]|nr:hypothetical protein [Solobacterium sp.]